LAFSAFVEQYILFLFEFRNLCFSDSR